MEALNAINKKVKTAWDMSIEDNGAGMIPEFARENMAAVRSENTTAYKMAA